MRRKERGSIDLAVYKNVVGGWTVEEAEGDSGEDDVFGFVGRCRTTDVIDVEEGGTVEFSVDVAEGVVLENLVFGPGRREFVDEATLEHTLTF